MLKSVDVVTILSLVQFLLSFVYVYSNVDNEPRIKLNRNIEGPARFPQFVNAGLCSGTQATNFCLWATRKTHFCIMLKGWAPQNSQLGPLGTTS